MKTIAVVVLGWLMLSLPLALGLGRAIRRNTTPQPRNRTHLRAGWRPAGMEANERIVDVLRSKGGL